jgi:hypothetical protein
MEALKGRKLPFNSAGRLFGIKGCLEILLICIQNIFMPSHCIFQRFEA